MYVMTITAHQAAIAFSQSALSFCWIQHFLIQQARATMVEVRTQYLCLLTDLRYRNELLVLLQPCWDSAECFGL